MTYAINKLIRTQAERTPHVVMDPEKGFVEIAGRSLPENSLDFFTPIKEWVDTYEREMKRIPLKVRILLEYFNTSSSKHLLDILKKFERISKHGGNVEITWFYYPEDDEMIDNGMEFQTLLDCKVYLKVYTGNKCMETYPEK